MALDYNQTNEDVNMELIEEAAKKVEAGEMPTEEAVRESLRQVVDPEIGLDVIALGLIELVNFIPDDKVVDVDMLLTTPFCPYAPWMVQQVKEKAEMVAPGWTADVEVLAKQWDPSMMEDPGLLGFGAGGW
ncbi:MAG: metal-sulfur cluster assembly factor [Chloroflexota bacterium]|nr:metal-sulfur cluster assembly factor [Chloroflexota bacterium]